MSTSHRGLPPPAAMNLPNHSPSSILNQISDRWQHGTEETQRGLLQAKSDEEKRRQEEERTKQESFRLEIRRTELEMLREAFRGGIPPHLVPIIFTGGGALAGTSGEWANHYISQLTHNQQQLLHGSIVSPPDSRLESRLLPATEHQTPRSGPLSSASQTPAQSQTTPSLLSAGQSHHPQHTNNSSSTYSPFNPTALPTTRGHSQHIHSSEPSRSSLPRINTNEIQVRPPPQGPPPGLNMQLSGIPPHSQPQNSIPHQTPQSHITPLQPAQDSHRPQPETSPIFFHHWQPPSTQPSSSAQAVSTSPASGKHMESSPFSSQPYLAGNEGSHSPKKRKFASTPGPVPNVQTTTFSSFSPGSSGGANKRRGASVAHSRHRSDSGSARGYEPYPKNPAVRPRRSDAGNTVSDSNVAVPISQFSISHMTGHEASPEPRHRDSVAKPQKATSQELSTPHPHFQAGPEDMLDYHIHKEKEHPSGHTPSRD
ncbi:hypothetical protein TWF694_011898 [Orbilia ellipsospora]|uniref:Uncharacterized protein n=1 Tax=Orbilia ellipsospora TaxID=2528407 RepID=A0AAV9X6M6_9PEZI